MLSHTLTLIHAGSMVKNVTMLRNHERLGRSFVISLLRLSASATKWSTPRYSGCHYLGASFPSFRSKYRTLLSTTQQLSISALSKQSPLIVPRCLFWGLQLVCFQSSDYHSACSNTATYTSFYVKSIEHDDSDAVHYMALHLTY